MRRLGLTILGISILLLLGTGLYYFLTAFFSDASVPMIVRVSLSGVILGVIILLISLIKERIGDKEDDYSDY